MIHMVSLDTLKWSWGRSGGCRTRNRVPELCTLKGDHRSVIFMVSRHIWFPEHDLWLTEFI